MAGPPKKKPAKPVTADKRAGARKSLVELALQGDADKLYALIEPGGTNDLEIYKWLHVARDLGGEDADELIGDMLELTSLRYDDSRAERAAAHWQLAVHYLEGSGGLPLDLQFAKRHLKEAFQYNDLSSINACTGLSLSAEPVLARLGREARTLLELQLAGGDPTEKVNEYIERVEHLMKCNAPEDIVDGERRRLQAAAAQLFAAHSSADPSLARLKKRVSRMLGG